MELLNSVDLELGLGFIEFEGELLLSIAWPAEAYVKGALSVLLDNIKRGAQIVCLSSLNFTT